MVNENELIDELMLWARVQLSEIRLHEENQDRKRGFIEAIVRLQEKLGSKLILSQKDSIAEKTLASDCPEFKFIEFNPRRKSRGVEAARLEADGDWIWMSKYDIECNIREFGPHPELLKALETYK